MSPLLRLADLRRIRHTWWCTFSRRFRGHACVRVIKPLPDHVSSHSERRLVPNQLLDRTRDSSRGGSNDRSCSSPWKGREVRALHRTCRPPGEQFWPLPTASRMSSGPRGVMVAGQAARLPPGSQTSFSRSRKANRTAGGVATSLLRMRNVGDVSQGHATAVQAL